MVVVESDSGVRGCLWKKESELRGESGVVVVWGPRFAISGVKVGV